MSQRVAPATKPDFVVDCSQINALLSSGLPLDRAQKGEPASVEDRRALAMPIGMFRRRSGLFDDGCARAVDRGAARASSRAAGRIVGGRIVRSADCRLVIASWTMAVKRKARLYI
jgi:hypothetical protein